MEAMFRFTTALLASAMCLVACSRTKTPTEEFIERLGGREPHASLPELTAESLSGEWVLDGLECRGTYYSVSDGALLTLTKDGAATVRRWNLQCEVKHEPQVASDHWLLDKGTRHVRLWQASGTTCAPAKCSVNIILHGGVGATWVHGCADEYEEPEVLTVQDGSYDRYLEGSGRARMSTGVTSDCTFTYVRR